MLHVFHIDAGRMLTFDVNYAAEPVATLQKALARTVNASPAEQILLISGGEVLDNAEKRVSNYSAGTDSNPIFLVCRPSGDYLTQSGHQVLGAPIPPDVANTADLDQQIQHTAHLPHNAQTMQHCVTLAHNMVQMADMNVERCTHLVFEQHLLHQGWLAVIANLDDTVMAFRQRFVKFRDKAERFTSQKQRAIDLLTSFDHDAVLLKKIPLLPCLRTGYDTLYEWIASTEPSHSLVDLAAGARQALDQLLDSRIFENLTNLESAALERAQDAAMKEIGGLGKRLARLDEYLQHVKNQQTEERQYYESLRAQEQRATIVGDASVVAELCLNHLSALKNMLDRHKKIADITRRFYEAKSELLKNIHMRLQWVADTHQLIQTGDSKVMMNGERLHRLRRQLELLKQLHDAPFVYASAVTEVLRRKSFSAEFIDWAEKLSAKSHQLYIEENRLRDVFDEKFARHFLRTLFPGMEDRLPEFAHEAPGSFDTNLPPIDICHIREIRKAVPQLQNLLQVQRPNVRERVWFSQPSRSADMGSESTLRREASFFSQTPPKYALPPVSESAPASAQRLPCQSPSWFAGDEIEFSPMSEYGGRELLGGFGAAKVGGGDAGQRMVTGSQLDLTTSVGGNAPTSSDESGQDQTTSSSFARSAPIKIPANNRGAGDGLMTGSRQFSEKAGSSKFGTPEEHLDDDDHQKFVRKISQQQQSQQQQQKISLHRNVEEDTVTKDESELAVMSQKLVEALEGQQRLRRQLAERAATMEQWQRLYSASVVPEFNFLRCQLKELKSSLEATSIFGEKSAPELAGSVDEACRLLEQKLQADLAEAQKAQTALRQQEMNEAMNEKSREIDDERQRMRELQKRVENSEAYLKQKDDVIELLQQKLQEQARLHETKLDEAKAELMTKLVIEHELSTDAMRIGYENELQGKESEILHMKQELAEKQQVLREMRREQDRLLETMCERETGPMGGSLTATDECEEKLRQVRTDLERDYKDKLQMLTVGLEQKHQQQMERVRKEKEVEVRMLRHRLDEVLSKSVQPPEQETVSDDKMASSDMGPLTMALGESTMEQSTTSLSPDYQEVQSPAGASAESDGATSSPEKPVAESDEDKQAVDTGDNDQPVAPFKDRAVQTMKEDMKISVMRIAKGDLVLFVYEQSLKSYVAFKFTPIIYVLKPGCLKEMGLSPADKNDEVAGESSQQQQLLQQSRWALGRVVDLDFCQIKKPRNRYRLPLNTRFYRVTAEPVILRT